MQSRSGPTGVSFEVGVEGTKQPHKSQLQQDSDLHPNLSPDSQPNSNKTPPFL